MIMPFTQWGKSANCNDVRYGCLDGLRGHYDHSGAFSYCMIVLSYNKELRPMRMTRHKKHIIEFYKPDNRHLVSLKAGEPPFDVKGVSCLLYGDTQRHHIEATRRTLNAMVNDGLLYRVKVREPRFDARIAGEGAHCTVVRYGLVENHADQ